MNKTFKVVPDAENVLTDKTMTANELINMFLNDAKEDEDAELLGWLTSCLNDDNDEKDDAVDFICEMWDMELEEV